MKFPVYLDNHATTQIDPVVLQDMMPWLTDNYGNPSSRSHSFGWMAEEAVKYAREISAEMLGVQPDELYFTGGATESNNTVLRGLTDRTHSGKDHIVCTKVEHSSVLKVFRYLELHGWRVTYLDVDSQGMIDLEQLEREITDKTLLVSVQAANNEIGTIYPAEKIADVCHRHSCLFHTDAAQAIGKTPLNLADSEIDFMSMSAHKIYGPKGTGLLYVKNRKPAISLTPLLIGGGQEGGLRSGTHNVPGIVGLASALRLIFTNMEQECRRTAQLRDRLYEQLTGRLDNVHLNGSISGRLPNNLNVSFAGTDISRLLAAIRNIAVSTGSACASVSASPSHVLEAIGLDEQLKKCSLRFGLGRFNTEEEIDYAAQAIAEAVRSSSIQ